jgi:hypothetical protein
MHPAKTSIENAAAKTASTVLLLKLPLNLLMQPFTAIAATMVVRPHLVLSVLLFDTCIGSPYWVKL